MKSREKADATRFLKKRGQELGFTAVGIARARVQEKEKDRLSDWLKNGFHGKMSWMERYFDLRTDVTKLLPGARSVIVFLYNYFPTADFNREGNFKIARYALGTDYHFVLKDKLKTLLSEFQSQFGEVSGRCFVDSAPVLERDWAKEAGLGWIGKNSLLLSKSSGSYFFISEIIMDFELEYDNPVADHCGDCTRCIDACPTKALESPYLLNSSKCISYLTIELKDSIPQQFRKKTEDWIFGCDICQEVCPWNRFSSPHREEKFHPSDRLKNMERQDWIEITKEVFQEIFRNSAVKRTGFSGLKRNIEFNK